MENEENGVDNFSKGEVAEFKKHSINALVLFGSRAQNISGPASDFDFGVILNDARLLRNAAKKTKIYNFLYDVLSPRVRNLANVDIVFLETAPAELQAHVMKYGRALFESKENIFADFRARVMESYADFAPLRAVFHSGILSRIQ